MLTRGSPHAGPGPLIPTTGDAGIRLRSPRCTQQGWGGWVGGWGGRAWRTDG